MIGVVVSKGVCVCVCVRTPLVSSFNENNSQDVAMPRSLGLVVAETAVLLPVAFFATQDSDARALVLSTNAGIWGLNLFMAMYSA